MSEQVITDEIWEGMLNEIRAGKSFKFGDPQADIWNAAHDRVATIVSHYRDGRGLFQITQKAKASNGDL